MQTVFVECTAYYRPSGPEHLKPVGETEFVNGVAAMCASGQYGPIRACAGIVSFADLTLGARVEEVLQAHVAAGNGRFRGIRHAAAWQDKTPEVRTAHTNPPPHLYRDDKAFREGMAVLGRMGLTFDAWIYHSQIPDLIALARAFPDQTIVLDHVGGPIGLGWYADKRAEILKSWTADIQELARCPNVVVKVGGMGMRINGFQFHKRERPPSSQELADAWRPWVETTIGAFGAEPLHVREQFPRRQNIGQLRDVLECLQASRVRLLGRRQRRRCSRAPRNASTRFSRRSAPKSAANTCARWFVRRGRRPSRQPSVSPSRAPALARMPWFVPSVRFMRDAMRGRAATLTPAGVYELATKFCQLVFTMIRVLRLLSVLILPATLLWGCARQPAFVTKDEPWRRTDETQCLQSGFVRESRYVHARSALGGPEACGAIQPFEMTAASSGTVHLVPAATLRCPMIPAVDHWVSTVVQPAARSYLGQAVVEVKVAASYSCRPRNGIFGGKLSEHGHANALDVSGFKLADGRWVTVKGGWSSWSAKAAS